MCAAPLALPDDSSWLTIAQASALVQLHAQTLRNAIKAGRLRAFRAGRLRAWRLRRADLDAWLTGSADERGTAVPR